MPAPRSPSSRRTATPPGTSGASGDRRRRDRRAAVLRGCGAPRPRLSSGPTSSRPSATSNSASGRRRPTRRPSTRTSGCSWGRFARALEGAPRRRQARRHRRRHPAQPRTASTNGCRSWPHRRVSLASRLVRRGASTTAVQNGRWLAVRWVWGSQGGGGTSPTLRRSRSPLSPPRQRPQAALAAPGQCIPNLGANEPPPGLRKTAYRTPRPFRLDGDRRSASRMLSRRVLTASTRRSTTSMRPARSRRSPSPRRQTPSRTPAPVTTVATSSGLTSSP